MAGPLGADLHIQFVKRPVVVQCTGGRGGYDASGIGAGPGGGGAAAATAPAVSCADARVALH